MKPVKKDLNGFTDAFYGCEKVKKIYDLTIYSKCSAFTAVKTYAAF